MIDIKYHKPIEIRMPLKKTFQEGVRLMEELEDSLTDWFVNISDTNLVNSEKARRLQALINTLQDLATQLPDFTFTGPEWKQVQPWNQYKHRNKGQAATRKARATSAANAFKAVCKGLTYYPEYALQRDELSSVANTLSNLEFPAKYKS